MSKAATNISLITQEDASALCALIIKNEKPWARFFPETIAQNISLEASVCFIEKFTDKETPSTYLYTLNLSKDNVLIGLVYLKNIDWDLKKGEFAYALDSDHTGNGYVSKAVRAVSNIAFKELGLTTLEIIVHKSNIPSIRVAEKCDFTWKKTLIKSFAPPSEDPLDMELYLLQATS